MSKINNVSDLIADIHSLFNENLVSVISYKGIFFNTTTKNKLHENLMIVVKTINFDLLEKIQDQKKIWSKILPNPPIIIEKAEILSSLDIFPAEYMQIKANYQLLAGDDVFENLSITQENLRLQIEYNIKSKLMILREEIIIGSKDPKTLLIQSLPLFLDSFQNILRLNNKPFKNSEPNSIIAELGKIYKIDTSLFLKLHKIIEGSEKVNNQEMKQLFNKYLSQLHNIALEIDKLILN